MRINQNIAALNTYRQLSANNVNTGKSLEKLSSGLRINRAGDDAAGLAISEKMRAQVRGLDQASRNSQDAISLIQTAEGALNETQSILQRMRELSVQAASDTNVAVDRGEIQKEINQLTSEINRIGNTTEFNTMKLLNGEKFNSSFSNTVIDVAAQNKAGASLVANAAEVAFADPTKPTFAGAITITSGSGNMFVDSNSSGNLTITRSGDYVIVTISGQSGAVSGYSVVSGDASGKYTFNDLGVSFTITSLGDWASGAAGAVTYSKSGGVAVDTSVSTSQDLWTIVSGTCGTTAFNSVLSGNVELASGLKAGKYYVSISTSADGTSGTITITVSGNSGTATSGTQIVLDKISGIQSGTGFVYNQNGITFAINNISGIGSGGSGTFSFTVVDEVSHTETGGEDKSLTFQIGANQNQSMSLSISDMRSQALGISTTTAGGDFGSATNVTDGTNSTNTEYSLDVSTAAKAAKAITVINNAIEKVSAERSKLGAVQNRLEHTINNLGTSSENLTAAESRIRDVDMAREMMNFTKNNILTQAAQSMLAQANQQPQGVLQLLR